MSILNLDLDLPADIPDLPPPWPPTDVAIEWWINHADGDPSNLSMEERLSGAARDHQNEPFVIE